MVCPQCQSILDDENSICEKCGWSSQKEQLQQPAPQKNKLTKNKKSKLKKILIPIFVVLALGLVTLIGRHISDRIYYNSDEYKILTATNAIINWDYKGATNILADVNTPEANAIKDFIKVSYAEKVFRNSQDDENFDIAEKAYFDFIDAIDTFEKESQPYCLPYDLLQIYIRNKTALDYSVNCVSDEIYDHFCDAQMIRLFDNRYRTGETFTLNEMKDCIETASSISIPDGFHPQSFFLTYFEVTDSKVINDCNTKKVEIDGINKTVIEIGNGFSNEYYFQCDNTNPFIQSIILEYEYILEADSEKYSPDAKLHITNPSSFDSSQNSDEDDFKKVHSIDDIYANSDRLKRRLRLDVAYYLIY